MKFQVTFKDPDAFYSDAAGNGLTDKELEKATEFARPWFEYGEYVTVEFDTEAKNARVRDGQEVK